MRNNIIRAVILPVMIMALTAALLSGCGLFESDDSDDKGKKTASITVNETIKEGEMPVIVVKPLEEENTSGDGAEAEAAPGDAGALDDAGAEGEMPEGEAGGDESDEPKAEETVSDKPTAMATGTPVGLNPEWRYASFSKINSGAAVYYAATDNRKGIVVGVNAGHGTQGGGSVKTYCHPDMTPKVTGGTTAAGSIEATAVSGGMSFNNGEKEADVNLKLARFIRDELLSRGYDVLMIRDGDDVQLDNVARTVICNNCADCHIAIHFDGDSTGSDKGCFFISVPDGIKGMEPVDRTWQMSEELGSQIVAALSNHGHKLHNGGSMDIDLTQTSYSSIPSVDVEYGNQCSDTSDGNLQDMAKATADGVEGFFQVAN